MAPFYRPENCFLTKGSRFAYHHIPHLLTDRFKPYLIPKRQCSYLQKVSRKIKGSRVKEEESDVAEASRVSNLRFQTPRLLSFSSIRLPPKAFEPLGSDQQELCLQ